MATLPESAIFEEGIFQLEKSTPPLGGAPVFSGSTPTAGHANAQAAQLANRTQWLREQINLRLPAVSNYTTLRSYSGDATEVRVLAAKIRGTFYLDSSDTTSIDNGGTIIVDGLSRRWKRVYESTIEASWFGAAEDGVTNDRQSVLDAYNAVMLQGGGELGLSPKSLVSGSAIGSNNITPTLVRSNRPGVRGVYDGTLSLPSKSDQPATYIQKYVSYDSGTDRYRLSPGAILAEVNALGSSNSTNQNDASWASIIANARMLNSNTGTQTSPVSDGYGSLTGLVGFAKANFFPGNGTAITGLWGYPSTITATDQEFDALSATGQGWATIGLEINLQIDHKDVGYRENVAGASTSIGSWLHNYRSSTSTSKSWNFGQVIDGGLTNDAVSQNLSTNWSSHYVGQKIDHSKTYGILFGRRMAPGSILIKGPDSHLLTDGRPLAFADTGDNPIIWGTYTGSTFNNGMMWQNSGDLFYRKAGQSYDFILNGEKALYQNATGVGVNTKTPGFNLDITAESGGAFTAITGYGAAGQVILRGALGTKTTPLGVIADSVIGFIGSRGYNGSSFAGGSSCGISMNAAETWTTTANGSYVTIGTTALGTTTRSERLRIDASGNILPGSDNTQNFGSGARRLKELFVATATINTSDRDAKTDIRDLSETEQLVASKCKKLIKAFKYKDAVQLKGDKARIHFGVIAQELVEVFESEGLDAHSYGVVCLDEWQSEPEITDEAGCVVREGIEGGSRYGVRYEELLAFIISSL